MRTGASPPSSAALLSHFEHGTVRYARGPVETATHQKTHARIPTTWAACAGTPLPHGWYYVRLRTSSTVPRRPGGRLSRETCRETRSDAAYQSRCFLTPSSTEYRALLRLGHPLPLAHHVSASFVIYGTRRHCALLLNFVMGVVTNTRPAPAQIITAIYILDPAHDESPQRHVRALCGLESAT
jgi:hypothetical protein